MSDLHIILAEEYPDKLWALVGDSYDGLDWRDDSPKPSLQHLESLWQNANLKRTLRNVRRERDALLAASDWTQAADAPVDSAAWAKYRQALRDLPAKIKDPTADVAWPEPPK